MRPCFVVHVGFYPTSFQTLLDQFTVSSCLAGPNNQILALILFLSGLLSHLKLAHLRANSLKLCKCNIFCRSFNIHLIYSFKLKMDPLEPARNE